MKSISERYTDAVKECRDAKAAFDKSKNTKTALHSNASTERYAEALNRVKRLETAMRAERVDGLGIAV